MIPVKVLSKALLTVAATIGMNLGLNATAWAQANVGTQILSGVINAATQKVQGAAGNIPQSPLPPGMIPAPAPANKPAVPIPWKTKEALLKATREGQFSGLPEIRVNQDIQTAPLTESVILILRKEYGVPSFTAGLDSDCRKTVATEIRTVFTYIAELHVSTLSDKPPSYYREINTQNALNNVQSYTKHIGTSGYCSTTILGITKPHPYVEALKSLANEFGLATKQYVQSERERRIAQFKADQDQLEAQQRAMEQEKAQKDAQAKAEQQKRIDAERARIDAEQKRRQQIEKSRISG